MGADTVGIFAFDPEDPECAALLAAHGPGAAALERSVVMRGFEWSAVCLRAGGGRWLIVPDAKQADALPTDFARLYKECGLRSLAAVPVGPPGGAPLGALVLARREPYDFGESRSALWMSAAGTALLQHMRPAQASTTHPTPHLTLRSARTRVRVGQAVRLLRSIDEAEDPVEAISALVQGGAGGGGDAPGAAAGAGTTPASPRESAVLASAAADDVTVTQLSMSNTLLASAVSLRQARFVQDAVAYLQNNPSPARDLFTAAAAAPVTSVVVVPLVGPDDAAVGALYFTQSCACDFANIQDALLGFVHCVTLTLQQKLAGQAAALKAMAVQPAVAAHRI
ncbi:hypothetical protein MNEG_12702 [Monoraphidium neglectum]|uniref:GAF domain-containing protein n=1 Tax=Monoraphidium neglectum TaxID=145388 RepID=A0A0D2MJZ7_9CHLO|nr:hypothetical protein MNEG_12702 [Monoraphidium neglectum]KIY95260.1 hypothetical protein MNEG_12702 [Monoraphidium neglectum]|eukprot:XP_013894280.1 hypothetical protein MNEG_12702 [Monoraphidium neglectum]